MRIGRCHFQIVRAACAAALLTMIAGCASLGASRVGLDRSDYTQRLRQSEKEQLLTNIVALRYGDAPLFLSVTSVISQYTRESSGRLDLAISPASGDADGNVGGSVLLRETPTVTYTPVSGDRFSRHLLAPLPPASLLAMMEAGWASDLLFRLVTRSINGVRNSTRAPLFEHTPDSDFEPLIAALRRLQRSQAWSIRLRQQHESFSAVARLREGLSVQEKADMDFVVKALGLKGDNHDLHDGHELHIVFATYPKDGNELAIATRSMFEVLMELSQCVELEDADALPIALESSTLPPLVRIRSGAVAPVGAHVAVQYRDRWFWIDADDEASKQMFLITQVMMSVADTGSGSGSPLVTIPAG